MPQINFEKLQKKAAIQECRMMIIFDPEEIGEQWGIKFYPDSEDDAHFFAYNVDLDLAARQILDELRGFTAW